MRTVAGWCALSLVAGCSPRLPTVDPRDPPRTALVLRLRDAHTSGPVTRADVALYRKYPPQSRWDLVGAGRTDTTAAGLAVLPRPERGTYLLRVYRLGGTEGYWWVRFCGPGRDTITVHVVTVWDQARPMPEYARPAPACRTPELRP